MVALNLVGQKREAEAEPIAREALKIRESKDADAWTTFNTKSLLGAALLGQKKYIDAEPLIVAGYEGMKAREPKIPVIAKPRLTQAGDRVIKLYESWGKPDKAALWRARLATLADDSKKPPRAENRQ
jgi:hypothetical protein